MKRGHVSNKTHLFQYSILQGINVHNRPLVKLAKIDSVDQPMCFKTVSIGTVRLALLVIAETLDAPGNPHTIYISHCSRVV